MARYRCPTCGAIGEVDKENKTLTVQYEAPKIPEPNPQTGNRPVSFKYPSHLDCEFRKTVDEIDVSKLTPVDNVAFVFEGVAAQ